MGYTTFTRNSPAIKFVSQIYRPGVLDTSKQDRVLTQNTEPNLDHDSEQDSQLPATDDAQSAFADHRISTPPQSPSKGGYLTRLLIFLALAFGVAPAIVGTLVRIFHASFSTADPLTLLWLDAGNFAFILALSAAMAVFEHRPGWRLRPASCAKCSKRSFVSESSSAWRKPRCSSA